MKNIFKTKDNFTEQEQEVITLIELLVNNSGTKIELDLESSIYYLQNVDLHYSAVIDSEGVKITNSSFSVQKKYKASVLDACKNSAKKRITEEVNKTKESIESREKEMFSKMRENLSVL